MPIEVKPDPTKFHTAREAANLLKVSAVTLRALIGKNEIYARKVGRSYKIQESEIFDFLNRRGK